MHILIIEDEPVIAQTIADLLATQGGTAELAYDGVTGLNLALTKQYDTVVLDIMLPGLDGFQVAQTLRRRGISTPILMLTARTQVGDRVNGLDSGADYYLTKPFSSQELLACLRAITRRRERVEETVLSYADLRLELAACVLSCGGRSVGLSQREMGLMSLFLRNAQRVISKEELIRQARGGCTEENSVEGYVSFLRNKRQHLGTRTAIRTLRTVGYRLEVQP